MFNFMKKNKPTPKTETPQQRAERDSAVDKVLLGYEVGALSIATWCWDWSATVKNLP